MKVGTLVRHVVHTRALGIIVDYHESNCSEAKVRWTNNGWGEKWELTQNFEVIDET